MNKILGYLVSLFMNETDDTKLEGIKEKLRIYLARDKEIQCAIVYKKDRIIMEEYFNEFNCSAYVSLNSITKSIISIIIGIALEQKLITDINQKLMSFFPELKTIVSDEKINSISIKHLLTMTSGINYQSSMEDLLQFKQMKEPVIYYLSQKLQYTPGEVFNYGEINVHLLSALISRISGVNAAEFAAKYLFNKLNIYEFSWDCDKQNINYGGSELMMKGMDVIKLGILYLKQGIYQKEMLISREWICESVKINNPGGKPVEESYGYLWWIKKILNMDSYFAYGYGGQLLYVIPDLEMVVLLCKRYDFQTV